MVSNLVSNQNTPASAKAYAALPYMNLTLDWHLVIVNGLFQAFSVGVDGFVFAVGWRLCVSLKLLTKLMYDTSV